MAVADFEKPEYYTNRELSWLDFNSRVLYEARDKSLPFLASPAPMFAVEVVFPTPPFPDVITITLLILGPSRFSKLSYTRYSHNVSLVIGLN